MSSKVIFVLGHAGVGKGTILQKLAKDFGYCALSVGEVLREELQKRGPYSQAIQASMSSGQLVEKEIAIVLLQQKVQSIQNKLIFIDGWPSSMDRLHDWTKIAGDCLVTFWFCCDEETRKARIRERGRDDDSPDLILKRAQTFHENMMPVILHYQKLQKLRIINTEPPIEETCRHLEQVLEELTQEKEQSPSVECWGIAGPTRSGKSTFSLQLQKENPGLIYEVIHADRYFLPIKPIFKNDSFVSPNWEVPEAVDAPRLFQHIQEAKSKCIDSFKGTNVKKVILVEGFLLFSLPQLPLDLFDKKLYFTIGKLELFKRRMMTTPVPVLYFDYLIWPSTIKYNSSIPTIQDILILDGQAGQAITYSLGKSYLLGLNNDVPSATELHTRYMSEDVNMNKFYQHYEKTGEVLDEDPDSPPPCCIS